MEKSKLYTGTGDNGQTSIYSCCGNEDRKLYKSDPRVMLLGELDQLNVRIGLLTSALLSNIQHPLYSKDTACTIIKNLILFLMNCQETIFNISSWLATGHLRRCEMLFHKSNVVSKILLSNDIVEQLEKWIDCLDAKSPPLTAFVLPGITLNNSLDNGVVEHAHFARTQCRNVESMYYTRIDSAKMLEPHHYNLNGTDMFLDLCDHNDTIYRQLHFDFMKLSSLVNLSESIEKMNDNQKNVRQFLNRLSDFMFALSRAHAHLISPSLWPQTTELVRGCDKQQFVDKWIENAFMI